MVFAIIEEEQGDSGLGLSQFGCFYRLNPQQWINNLSLVSSTEIASLIRKFHWEYMITYVDDCCQNGSPFRISHFIIDNHLQKTMHLNCISLAIPFDQRESL